MRAKISVRQTLAGRAQLKLNTRRHLEGALFIAPWVFGFLVFTAYPVVFSFIMSLNQAVLKVDGIHLSFWGLNNYNEVLLKSPQLFYDQLLPFLQQSLMMIPIIVVFSLLVAILLNHRFWGRSFFRAVFFIPVILSASDTINQLISQGQGTLAFLEKLNLSSIIQQYFPASWASPLIAVTQSFVLILWYSGVEILIFLAGRQSIPGPVYEAARIDGASPWEAFWKITLPAMIPFILLNTIYCVVDLFTYPGNPVMNSVLQNQYDGYGINSAIVWVYFTFILLFLALIFALFARSMKNFQSRN